jgi:hypothetical protein
MAIPHYVYLLLKMPIEKGLLSLSRVMFPSPTTVRRRVMHC